MLEFEDVIVEVNIGKFGEIKIADELKKSGIRMQTLLNKSTGDINEQLTELARTALRMVELHKLSGNQFNDK